MKKPTVRTLPKGVVAEMLGVAEVETIERLWLRCLGLTPDASSRVLRMLHPAVRRLRKS